MRGVHPLLANGACGLCGVFVIRVTGQHDGHDFGLRHADPQPRKPLYAGKIVRRLHVQELPVGVGDRVRLWRAAGERESDDRYGDDLYVRTLDQPGARSPKPISVSATSSLAWLYELKTCIELTLASKSGSSRG
jgi:hypothetical protein